MHYVKKRPAVFLLAYVGTKKVAQLSANVAELGLSQTAAKQPSQDDRLRITVVTDLIYWQLATSCVHCLCWRLNIMYTKRYKSIFVNFS